MTAAVLGIKSDDMRPLSRAHNCRRVAPNKGPDDIQPTGLHTWQGAYHGNVVQAVGAVEHHALLGQGLGQVLGGLRLACRQRGDRGMQVKDELLSQHHMEDVC